MITDPMSRHDPWTIHNTATREADIVRRAIRSVMSNAHNADDARLILDALGLDPAAGLTPNRPQETTP